MQTSENKIDNKSLKKLRINKDLKKNAKYQFHAKMKTAEADLLYNLHLSD